MSDWNEEKRDEINQGEMEQNEMRRSDIMIESQDMESQRQESDVQSTVAEDIQSATVPSDAMENDAVYDMREDDIQSVTVQSDVMEDNAAAVYDMKEDDAPSAATSDDMSNEQAVQEQQWSYDEAAYTAPDRSYIPSEPPQTSGNKAMVVVLSLMFLLLAGLCVFVVKTLSDGLEGLRTKKDVEYESESDDPWAEILGEEITEDEDEAAHDDADWDIAQDGFDRADFEDESWKEDYQNHAPSEFKGPYYEDFVDCIDESTSYQVKREFEECLDKKYNVCIRTSYVQLEGDIPNLDAINEQLKELAMMDLSFYQENEEDYHAFIEKAQTGIRSDTKSMVTYNDEETLSVAVLNESDFGYAAGLNVKGINVNLVTGTVMDNTKILKIDDSFGEEFRQRSNAQNGNSYGIEMFSNLDIVSMLNDKESIIIFYTPIGMELGYSYDKGGYVGWITISMQDYQKYLNGV